MRKWMFVLGGLALAVPVHAQAPRQQTPMPLLGVYHKDRVSLADPSLEASVAMTLLPQSPERVNQVGFTPWNLPDPFEHVAPVRLRQPWAESPQLPVFFVAPTTR